MQMHDMRMFGYTGGFAATLLFATNDKGDNADPFPTLRSRVLRFAAELGFGSIARQMNFRLSGDEEVGPFAVDDEEIEEFDEEEDNDEDDDYEDNDYEEPPPGTDERTRPYLIDIIDALAAYAKHNDGKAFVQALSAARDKEDRRLISGPDIDRVTDKRLREQFETLLTAFEAATSFADLMTRLEVVKVDLSK